MALTAKQRLFVEHYLTTFNATQSAILAGYSEQTAGSIGWELLKKPQIFEGINERVALVAMSANERLIRLSEIARDKENERTADRLKAIELLGKLAGDYVQKVETAGGGGLVKGYYVVSPDDWDKLSDAELERIAKGKG